MKVNASVVDHLCLMSYRFVLIMKLRNSYYVKLLVLILYITLPRATQGCSQGYVQAGSACVAQDSRCPPNHVYFNGVCNAITQNTCTTNEVSINNRCCPVACITICAQQQTCQCCGISNVVNACAQQSTCCSSATCTNSPVCPPCHPNGTVLKNGRCLVIECPDGTFWNGLSCLPVKPIEHDIVFNHAVTSHFNGTKTDVVIHRVSNLTVDASVTLQLSSKHGDHEHHDHSDCDDNISDEDCKSNEDDEDDEDDDEDKCETDDCQDKEKNKSQKCCTVRSPRVCENKNGRWTCHSRRKHVCGKICVAPTVYLRPPRIHYQHPFMVMPPMLPNCRTAGMCPPVKDYYNCSGCSGGHMEFCSSYCYRYNCPSYRCRFYDQRQYCGHYPGSFGCQEPDGCYESWCSNAM
uniref:Uncharacterized protein n=1 Tax=Glossina brevipalpis TaxID=37001 RepID=A0A1A9WAM2_9MUSC